MFPYMVQYLYSQVCASVQPACYLPLPLIESFCSVIKKTKQNSLFSTFALPLKGPKICCSPLTFSLLSIQERHLYPVSDFHWRFVLREMSDIYQTCSLSLTHSLLKNGFLLHSWWETINTLGFHLTAVTSYPPKKVWFHKAVLFRLRKELDLLITFIYRALFGIHITKCWFYIILNAKITYLNQLPSTHWNILVSSGILKTQDCGKRSSFFLFFLLNALVLPRWAQLNSRNSYATTDS